jgi:hypothetical protein
MIAEERIIGEDILVFWWLVVTTVALWKVL